MGPGPGRPAPDNPTARVPCVRGLSRATVVKSPPWGASRLSLHPSCTPHPHTLFLHTHPAAPQPRLLWVFTQSPPQGLHAAPFGKVPPNLPHPLTVTNTCCLSPDKCQGQQGLLGSCHTLGSRAPCPQECPATCHSLIGSGCRRGPAPSPGPPMGKMPCPQSGPQAQGGPGWGLGHCVSEGLGVASAGEGPQRRAKAGGSPRGAEGRSTAAAREGGLGKRGLEPCPPRPVSATCSGDASVRRPDRAWRDWGLQA